MKMVIADTLSDASKYLLRNLEPLVSTPLMLVIGSPSTQTKQND